MAEQLKDFNFGRLRARGGSWADEYLTLEDGETEGNIWKLSSEDSPSGVANIRSMQTNLANTAKRKGLKIRTNVITEEEQDEEGLTYLAEYLIVQAYLPEDEE